MVDPRPKSLPEPPVGVDPLYERMRAVYHRWTDGRKSRAWWVEELVLLENERLEWEPDLLEQAVSLFESMAYELDIAWDRPGWALPGMSDALDVYNTKLLDLRILRNRRKLKSLGPDIFALTKDRTVPINETDEVVGPVLARVHPWGQVK